MSGPTHWLVPKLGEAAQRRREPSVFDKHQLKIAKRTLQMSDVGAKIMGGMTKEEARAHIKRITGSAAKEESIEEQRNYNGDLTGDMMQWEQDGDGMPDRPTKRLFQHFG